MITKERIWGLSHLCHHDRHWEICYDYDERVKYIKEHKPADEQKARLKFFQIVSWDKLPGRGSPEWQALIQAVAAYGKAGAACGKAVAACGKAGAAYGKAVAACDKAVAACDKAVAACGKAVAACDKAEAAYDKALGNYLSKFAGELDKLHAELFPDCPWSEEQRTMFPERKK